MIFATKHASDDIIAVNARICCFENRANAEAWLLAGHSDGLHPRVVAGKFISYWKETHSGGTLEVDAVIAPFTADQIETTGPGELHAGNCYGHRPAPEVLVLVDRPSGE